MPKRLSADMRQHPGQHELPVSVLGSDGECLLESYMFSKKDNLTGVGMHDQLFEMDD